MALLDSVGADPVGRAVQIDDLRIEVNPGFRTVITADRYGSSVSCSCWLSARKGRAEVSVDEINELVQAGGGWDSSHGHEIIRAS